MGRLVRVGAPKATPGYVGFDNYVYLLKAAAAGRGLALGWLGMVERYFEAGALLEAADLCREFDRPFFAVLRRRGRDRPVARKCLSFFGEPCTGLVRNE